MAPVKAENMPYAAPAEDIDNPHLSANMDESVSQDPFHPSDSMPAYTRRYPRESRYLSLVQRAGTAASLLLCLVTMGIAAYPAGAITPPELSITRIAIVSGTGSATPDRADKVVESNQTVTLWALVQCSSGYYLGEKDQQAPTAVRLDGRVLRLADGTLKRWPVKKAPSPTIRWYRVLPRMKPTKPLGNYEWYANVFDEGDGIEGSWRGWQTLEYEQQQLITGSWSCRLPPAAATYRFRVEAAQDDCVVSSPGSPDASHPSGVSSADYDRGIARGVHRIMRLSNHPVRLLQYVEGYRDIPWLWGADYRDPPTNTPRLHQSDLYNLVGIECSSLIVSALRAMGHEDLTYTTAKHLSLGKYCEPASSARLTLKRADLFASWVPSGLACASQHILIYGGRRMQWRDARWARKQQEHELPGVILDVATGEGVPTHVLLETEDGVAVGTLSSAGEYTMHFAPAIERTVTIGRSSYSVPVHIRPSGIALKRSGEEMQICLLYENQILLFDQQGNHLSSIALEESRADSSPLGQLFYSANKFWLPHQDGSIEAFTDSGDKAKTVELGETIVAAAVSGTRILALHPFPLTLIEYGIDGILSRDYQDVFQNEAGASLLLPIGAEGTSLRLGDLFVTVEPFYHVLLLFADNGNGHLDSRDKVVCAGHEGIEVREVGYFEDKWFVIRRLREELLQETR